MTAPADVAHKERNEAMAAVKKVCMGLNEKSNRFAIIHLDSTMQYIGVYYTSTGESVPYSQWEAFILQTHLGCFITGL